MKDTMNIGSHRPSMEVRPGQAEPPSTEAQAKLQALKLKPIRLNNRPAVGPDGTRHVDPTAKFVRPQMPSSFGLPKLEPGGRMRQPVEEVIAPPTAQTARQGRVAVADVRPQQASMERTGTPQRAERPLVSEAERGQVKALVERSIPKDMLPEEFGALVKARLQARFPGATSISPQDHGDVVAELRRELVDSTARQIASAMERDPAARDIWTRLSAEDCRRMLEQAIGQNMVAIPAREIAQAAATVRKVLDALGPKAALSEAVEHAKSVTKAAQQAVKQIDSQGLKQDKLTGFLQRALPAPIAAEDFAAVIKGKAAAATGSPAQRIGNAAAEARSELVRSLVASVTSALPKDPGACWAVASAFDETGVACIADALQKSVGHLLSKGELAAAAKDLHSALIGALPERLSPDGKILTVGGKVYDEGAVLGKGAFGSVREFKPRDGGPAVVTKEVSARGGGEFDDRHARVWQEYSVIRYAKQDAHPNMLGVLGIARMPNERYCLVLEKADGGDFVELRRKLWKAPDRDKQLANWHAMRGAADGLAHLHARGISHLDVKPPNILYDRASGQAKVVDFGVSLNPLSTDGDIVRGTPGYVAPEMWATGGTPQSDVFSLGITFYEMAYGPLYTYGRRPQDRTEEAIERITEAVENKPLPTPLDDMVLAMIAADPAKRPTMEDVLAMPYWTNPLRASTPPTADDLAAMTVAAKQAIVAAYPKDP